MKTFIRNLLFKHFLLKISLIVALIVITSYVSNKYIENSTENQIYTELNKVPVKKVAIVLGASKFFRSGAPNAYFDKRIKAAADLYHSGKVSHLLVSGDNHVQNYNEPEDMMNSLVVLGVPEECITMDFAGFRTFDSMVRAKEVFGVTDCIIVSQKYHLQRALFIANSYDINAIGYCAEDVAFNGRNVREYLAKYKAVLDCYVLFTEPKFLGSKEYINIP